MTSSTPLSLDRARFNMIEQQVRPWEVLDPAVLELLDRVRRDQFVSRAQKALAYVDMELPLGHGADQVMLAPRVQARMVQDLALKATDKVLEIGTGSGYTTALLASLAQRVVSLEIDDAIASAARKNLQQAGITNAEVRVADAAANGFAACAAEGPWDAILVAGSVAEVPAGLLALLTKGGRLIAIVGHEPVMRATVVTRVDDAGFSTQQPWDTIAPRLRNFAEPSRFSF
ncbi:protein-L-isoaspartate O-methyltransferase family protein [Hydrogenophaga pseudoflava]|uniref:Protein-L-isoaspartate O-methyltransferase n=1 Tax=Hydrogenophaga pseudoflava TaxID=47421 RepID=A0A4P6WZH1_HYDPS|nr:protein-L-isoaspartate O-methyltransferase [Hydrogenophaga pseudoflava]QBM29622.1 Protein-L-isoaspartate O-methyltransferase [Hydrogenophaga pseudoflava]